MTQFLLSTPRFCMLSQALVDPGRARHVRLHRGAGRRVRDEVRRVVVAGLGDVHDPSAIDAIAFTMSGRWCIVFDDAAFSRAAMASASGFGAKFRK